MTRYDIINVGQGDCMIVHPEEGCKPDTRAFMIDLGFGTRDVTDCLSADEKVHIFLTQHDMRHAGGFKFFWAGGIEQVEEITVPFFQNEISLIARALLGLKGMQYAEKSAEFITELEQLVSNQLYFVKCFQERNSVKVTYGYQDKQFGKHITCLNPPIFIPVRNWLKDMSDREIELLLRELFEEDAARAFTAYFCSKKNRRRETDSKLLNELCFHVEYEAEYYEEIEYQKANYVMDFIQENIQALRMVNISPKRKNVLAVYNQFINVLHDVSLVLKLEYEDASMLAAGDASTSVFYRLMDEEVDISATYLKMPYHGSKKNMTKKILHKIAPEKVIFSHNNRRFGNDKDAYPSKKMLKMLMEQNIEILAANDVRKGPLYAPFIYKSIGKIDESITFR